MIEAVDGDRLLSALDLTDELSAQPRALAQALLTQPPLLAERPQPLAQEFSHVLDRSFCHTVSPLWSDRIAGLPQHAAAVGQSRMGLGERLDPAARDCGQGPGVQRSW